MIENTNKLNLSITSTPDNLKCVGEIIDELGLYNKLSQDEVANIELVLGEAISNAIMHGNKCNSNKVVDVTAFIDESTLKITVKDEGDGFNYNAVPDPTLPENIEKPTGRGVFLMKQFCDYVVFENNGSCVELNFKF